MKLVTYAITPKLAHKLEYKYVSIIVDDPIEIILLDNEYYQYIINVLDLNEEQVAKLDAKLSGDDKEP